jgi:hypothetical protein
MVGTRRTGTASDDQSRPNIVAAGMAGDSMSNVKQVTLPLSDWVHVVHAIHSSYERKMKRKEYRAADETAIIGSTIIRQCVLEKQEAKR